LLDKVTKQKDEEIAFLENKLAEYDNTIRKYSDNLVGIKSSADKTIADYKRALGKKNDDLRHMKEHYDNVVKDVRIKCNRL
jgi:hypothetical protein